MNKLTQKSYPCKIANFGIFAKEEKNISTLKMNKTAVTFFTTQNDFRTWLEKYHREEKELLVGFYKVGSKIPSMTWSESVDQALCFGWIDGVRRSIDAESYCIRFTPRKRSSIWSHINIEKVHRLTALGLMAPEGLKAFQQREIEKSGIYSHENDVATLEIEYEKKFKSNTVAWDFFNKQAPSYKKVTLHWIMRAKLEKTRLSRLEKIIQISSEQRRLQ